MLILFAKLTALSRILNYMELPKRRILINAFLKLSLTITCLKYVYFSFSYRKSYYYNIPDHYSHKKETS